MSQNLIKAPFFRAIAARGLAQAAPVSGKASYDVENTTLSNNLVVASAENNSPITRISILFKAGSRNETPDMLGATHLLRISAGLSTKNATQFAIIRNIQQVGANLTCMTGREIVCYTLEGTRNAVETVMPFLTEVATQQVFKPWELSDNIPRIKYELATRPPQQRAVDLLHKASYRQGLGNSIYFSKHQIGKISSESMQHFVASNFTSQRGAVVGLGVDHGSLKQYAQTLTLKSDGRDMPASPYKGGEIRSDKGGDFAHVAIGLPRCGYNDPNEGLAIAVLERALGIGPMIKRGHSAGILGKTLGEGDFAAAALNLTYSDTGLFGLLISTPAKQADKVVRGGVDLLKKGLTVTDEDVTRGKNQLKMALYSKAECGGDAIGIIGNQALFERCAQSVEALANSVDAISTSAVNAAASKIAAGRLSVAAVGNLEHVPFLDDMS